MEDRSQFLQSMNYPEGITTEDIITYFFDQYMLLYNLVGDVRKKSLLNSSTAKVSFEIEFFGNTSVNVITNTIINNPTVVIYESTYILSCTPIRENVVIITISK